MNEITGHNSIRAGMSIKMKRKVTIQRTRVKSRWHTKIDYWVNIKVWQILTNINGQKYENFANSPCYVRVESLTEINVRLEAIRPIGLEVGLSLVAITA